MTTATAAFAAFFASLTVAFPRAEVVARANYFGGVRGFRNFIASHNNICEIEHFRGYVTFRATAFVCENIARHGFDVRRIEGDKYMVRRSMVGVLLTD